MRVTRYWPYCRRVIVEYGTAVVFVGAATIATALLRKIFPGLPGSLFFCAVMLSAWRGGLGPGLLASILSSAVFVLWVAPPAPIRATPWHEVPRIVMLLFASVFISWLCGQQKRSQAALQQARDELEQRVNERTKELAASEAKLKEAQRLANIGYWERDLLTGWITWSEETCRIFGLPSRPQGLSQAELQEMIHPDDRQLQAQALSRAVQGTRRYDVEYRIIPRDGEVRYVHVRDQIERDSSGRPIRLFGTVQDITERKHIEDALREREELMRVLTENANDFVRLHDVQGRSIYSSPSVERLFGRLPSSLFEFAHPDDLEECQRWWNEVMADGSPRRLQWRVRDACGNWRWLETTASEFQFKGRPHVLTVCRDVTERKRADETVRASQQLLELVLATLPVGVAVTNKRGDIVLANAASKRIWGDMIVSGAERWERSYGSWHDSGQRITSRNWASARALTDGQTSLNELIDIETYDGQQKTIQNSAAPIRDAEGGIVGAVFVNEDVTERVRAEETLRAREREIQTIVENSPDWIVRFDRALRWTYVNPAFIKATGLPAESLLGRKIGTEQGSTATAEEIENDTKALEHVLQTGQPLALQYSRALPAGKRHFIMQFVPEFDGHGAPASILGIARDITELKEQEEKLRQIQTELARVARLTMMGELTAAIAHEVNQPLAAVVANADAASRWLAPVPPNLDEARQAIRRIARDGNRASEVIKRIRAIMKKGEPMKTPVDLRELIQETVALIQPQLNRKRVTLKTEFAPDLPRVTADRVQLQQVLLNLAVNAIDSLSAVPDRPRVLRIRADRFEPDAVQVAVQDTGVGLPPQETERVFEPFYTTKPEGLGMGLAISRSIVEAHGGRLWATPHEGSGATFQFTLPVRNGGGL